MLAKANCAQLIQSQLQTKIESKYAEACSWKNERISKKAIFSVFCLKPVNLTKITGKYLLKQNSKKVSWWSCRPTAKVIFRLRCNILSKNKNFCSQHSVKAKKNYLTTSEQHQNNFFKSPKSVFFEPKMNQNTGKYQLQQKCRFLVLFWVYRLQYYLVSAQKIFNR